MPRLKAANNARTVLTQAVGVSDTTIYVEDVSKFPAPPFRITVDNEIMEVTAVDSGAKAFTVMRAQEGTAAASHSVGAVVENRWTAGTYNELLSQAELAAHLADYVRQTGYAVATGSANNYSVTLNPAPPALVEGLCVAVKINVTNTGPSTLNVNGLGAKLIKKPNGNDVGPGNLKAGSIYTLRYNGENFILQGEGGSGNAQPADVLSGKTFTNDQGEQVGIMPNRGAVVITPGTQNQTIAQGYHNGQGYVKGDPNLIPQNIVSGKSIFGVAGSAIQAPLFFHPILSLLGRLVTGRWRTITVTSDQEVYAPSGKCWIVFGYAYAGEKNFPYIVTAADSPHPRGIRVYAGYPMVVYELDTTALYYRGSSDTTLNLNSQTYMVAYWHMSSSDSYATEVYDGRSGYWEYYYSANVDRSKLPILLNPTALSVANMTISLIKIPTITLTRNYYSLSPRTQQLYGTVPTGKVWVLRVLPTRMPGWGRFYLATVPKMGVSVYDMGYLIACIEGQTIYIINDYNDTHSGYVLRYELDL